jgi:hypothetical protein
MEDVRVRAFVGSPEGALDRKQEAFERINVALVSDGGEIGSNRSS